VPSTYKYIQYKILKLNSSYLNLKLHFISKFTHNISTSLCCFYSRSTNRYRDLSQFSFVEIINRSSERSLLYRAIGGWRQNLCRIVVICAFSRGNWYLQFLY